MARPLIGFLLSCLFCSSAAAQTLVRPPAPQNGAGRAQGAYPVRTAADNRPVAPTTNNNLAPPQVQIGNQGAPAVIPATPQQPEWAGRMPPEELKWIDDVLRAWETRSDKVKIFECSFQRWDYDGGWVDAGGKRHPRMYAEGDIKYAQPDKGLYHVVKLVSVMPPNDGGAKPQEVIQNPELGEHWICDGEQIYSFEASKKQVTVNPLPPDMRGKAIADGPLPFMFGAKAETIKARYWIRRLAAHPEDKTKQNKYWLEAVPKSRQDAQNFKMVRIVLDNQEFLPESIEIFAPNFDPPRNDARQSYLFSKRAAKDDATIADMIGKGLDPFGIIRRDFYEPRIPTGWKKVVQAPPGDAAAPPPQQAGPAPPPRLPTTLPR
jgi:TIGR03009 family protein